MSDDVRGDGERIARLLDEVRAMAGPTTWRRVEELVASLVRLYGAGLARALASTAAGRPLDEAVADRLAADELVSSLLLLHGLHPVPAAERVAQAVEAVRARLDGDAGVALEAIGDDGVVRVRVTVGADQRCGFSAAALARTIEHAVVEAAPEVARVEVLGLAPPRAPERLVSIGAPGVAAKVRP